MNPALSLRTFGQQIWLDNLSRSLLREGQLERYLAECGVSGITTNPAIFHKAIAGGRHYEDDLAALKRQPLSPEARYEALAIADVRAACDILAPCHRESGGEEGYVSLEVSPALAHDAPATIAAGLRLRAAVDRPNLLIKVPATAAGLDALTGLIDAGVNVNVTLMFSLAHVRQVAQAYLEGLSRRHARGEPLETLYSVASLFLSRVDTRIDACLAGQDSAAQAGASAVAMARLAYREHLAIHGGERFAALKAAGARPQYLLWASTGTKNPAYSDLLYVEPLIGPRTINTLPEDTLKALLDHGRPRLSLTEGLDEADAQFAALASAGIDPEAIGQSLQAEGLAQFETAFQALLDLMA